MPARYVLFLALLCAATACYRSHNSDADETVRKRAAFDFSCDPAEIRITPIDDSGGVRKLSTQVGAQGCGQKAVYIYLVSTDTWVANASLSAEMIEQEEQYIRQVQQQQ